MQPVADTLFPGGTRQLSTTVRDAKGNDVVRAVTWESTDPSTASVGSTGLVAAVKPGAATITASVDGVRGQAVIVVRDGGVATPAGTTIRAANDSVTLIVPPGAVAANTPLFIERTPSAAPDSRMIPGSAFTFGPDGTTFATPVTVKIKADTAKAPNRNAAALRLALRSGAGYTTVTGSGLDPIDGSVTGSVAHFSQYVVLGQAPIASIAVQPSTISLPTGGVQQLTATPRDSAGNPLSGLPVAWATPANGVLTIEQTGTVTAMAVGVSSVTASTLGITGTASITVVKPPAVAIEAASPAAQGGLIGQPVLSPPAVRLTDVAGRPVEGVTVSFAIVDGGGSVTGAVQQSGSDGVARVGSWTLGPAPGANTVVGAVQVGGIAGNPVTFTATAIVPPYISLAPSSLTFSGPQGGPNPIAKQVAISNSGGGTLGGLAVGPISYGAGASGWLPVAALSASTAPATVTVRPDVASLASGTYTATIPLHSSSASNSPVDITVTVTVTAAAACAAPAPEDDGPTPSTTNVLVDLSHEFTFTYDIFSGHAPYWNPGFSRTAGHASLASTRVALGAYDIIVIDQEDSGVVFGEDEIQRLLYWVRQGGGRLILVSRGNPFPPLTALASRFGVEFATATATKPYVVRAHPATTGVSTFATANGAAPATVLRTSCACDVLVADAVHQPVVVACPQGAGKIVAISEPAFIANPYVQGIINVQFTKQLLTWLGPRKRPDATVPWRILPDLERSLAGGAKLLYTARTAGAPFVNLVEAEHAHIDAELQRITGLQNIYKMTFVALPCRNGGYSGGAEVGVCGYEAIGGLTLVFAHELMHSFDNPNPPPEMMHPVVSYVAGKVGIALGGAPATAAANERQLWDAGFKSADPTGRLLDVTNEALFDRRGKMYWIIGRLEGTYPFSTANLYDFPIAARDPSNVLKRYYQRKRADVGYAPTPTNTVRLLSIAACRDLFPDFRAVGTTLGATPAGLAAEIAAACP
ncbi:MAG: Ig-like domain-containing protein [Gemmatimonadetes bacterium]|nr:Ig-like domain-containing protein [Gemmatimonadota bacterium]MCC7131687.1 Ig-like domain-containing protein [Gemmatimonadales bacterium]